MPFYTLFFRAFSYTSNMRFHRQLIRFHRTSASSGKNKKYYSLRQDAVNRVNLRMWCLIGLHCV